MIQWAIPAVPDLSVMASEGAVQELRRVEDVVDLLVLREPAGVDAGPGVLKLGRRTGSCRGSGRPISAHVVGQLGDDRGVDAGMSP